MKKSTLALVLSLCGVLVGVVVLGRFLLQPQPHQSACEAIRVLISFNGINYTNPYPIELAHPPSTNELGPVVGTAGEPPQHTVHYTCGLLSDGDKVYSIKGYQTSFRLATRTSNDISFFEVSQNPQAKTGSDLLDIGGKVQSIAVSPINDLDHPTHIIHDAANVQKLVNKILMAPIASQCTSNSHEEALLFHLQDGSIVVISYSPSGTELATNWPQCIQLPQDFTTGLS